MKKVFLILLLAFPLFCSGQHLNIPDLINLYDKDFNGMKIALGKNWLGESKIIDGESKFMFTYQTPFIKDKNSESLRKVNNGYMSELNYLLTKPDYYNILLLQAKRDLDLIADDGEMLVFQSGSHQVAFVIKKFNTSTFYMVNIAKI